MFLVYQYLDARPGCFRSISTESSFHKSLEISHCTWLRLLPIELASPQQILLTCVWDLMQVEKSMSAVY